MTAACKTADVDNNLLTALNAIPDLAKMGGCSTLIVEPGRSSTGGPLFGRLSTGRRSRNCRSTRW